MFFDLKQIWVLVACDSGSVKMEFGLTEKRKSHLKQTFENNGKIAKGFITNFLMKYLIHKKI